MIFLQYLFLFFFFHLKPRSQLSLLFTMVVQTCVEIHGNIKEGKIKSQILKNNFDITVGTWEIAIESLIAHYKENLNTVVRCDFSCLQFFEELDFNREFRHGSLSLFQLDGKNNEIKTVIQSGQNCFKTFQSSEIEIIFYFNDLLTKQLVKKDIDIYMTLCFRRVH